MKKRILSLFLVSAMFLSYTTVWADESKVNLYGTYSTMLSKSDDTLEVITFDEVLAKVKKYSASIQSNSMNVDLSEKKADVAGSNQVYSSSFSSLSSFISAQLSYQSAKLSQQSYEKSLEYSVQQAYIQIIMAEKNLELSKISLENDKFNLSISEKKYSLGMMSNEAYENAKLAYETAKLAYQNQVDSLNKEYESLNTMMGVKAEVRYKFEYPAYYEKLELNNDIDAYANAAVTKAMSVKIKELAVTNAKENKDSYYTGVGESMSTEAYRYDTLKNNITTAELELRDQKDSVKTNVKNLYTTIKQSELTLDKDIKDLENSKNSLELAKKRYDMGLISKQELSNTEYATTAKELGVLNSIYNHMLNVEKINNPSLF